jgi:hypothetical protein
VRSSAALLAVLAIAGAAALVWVQRGETPPRADDGGVAPPSRAEPPAGPPPIPRAVLSGGGRTGRAVAEVRAELVPTEAAVSYLLACQGEDGLFHEDRGALEGDPPSRPGRSVAATAFACLALVDAVSPSEDAPASKAARRALDRLAALQGADGSVGDDLESRALAAWALAAGYSRTGRAEWGRTVAPSLRYLLSEAHADGGWRTGRGLAEDLVVSAWAVAFLFEVSPMDETVPDPRDAHGAIERAAEWAESVEDEAEGLTGAAACAHALLLRLGGPVGEGPRPDAVLRPRGEVDAAACLLGTVFAFHDGARWPAWREAVVEPVLERRRREEPASGSWSPGAGRGRVESTAAIALAWMSVATPYRPPRGR